MMVPVMAIFSLTFGIKWGDVIGGLALIISFLSIYVSPVLMLISLIGYIYCKNKEIKK